MGHPLGVDPARWPPGWYRDPQGGPHLRWWTGQGWTADVRAPAVAPPPWARRMVVAAPATALAAAVAATACSRLGDASRHPGGLFHACTGTSHPLLGAGLALTVLAVAASLASIGPVVRVRRGPDGPLRQVAIAATVALPLAAGVAVVSAALAWLSYACLVF